jgi:hypothetical protein
MRTVVISIPVNEIRDWGSFHSVFQAALGFPDFYGRNLDAWIDCMTSIDKPADGLTSVAAEAGDLVALRIDNAADFQRRCPEQFDALIECAAFVNYRRIEVGKTPVLTLMLNGWISKPE